MKYLLLASALSTNGDVVFKEMFDTMSAWTSSTWKGSSEMQEFTLGPLANAPTEKALSTTQDARFYASSAHFPKEVSIKGKSLLVQYEVTYDKDVECGGGYIKIGPKIADPKTFGDPTEYALMFGPDKCGHSKRTHLIFNYGGKNQLKKVDLPYKQDDEGITTLYRLMIHPDNSVVVHINGEEVYKGSMESDWDLLPAKEINDPDDKKPADWVDDAMINDPNDKKPADWVDVKEIFDEKATQPADWDSEEDGTWEPPMIPNPDFKGEWQPKRISNPDYKGVWAPKKIANPEYKEDNELYLMNKSNLAFIGFDLWQVKAGSRFDNIIIATGKAESDGLMKEADAMKTACMTMIDAQKKLKESTTTTTTTTVSIAEDTAGEKDEDDDL